VTTDQRIQRFRVERALGSGAFATVWLARDEQLDGLVALKILADNWSRNDDARRRFVEEARSMRLLDSDRVVRVYELSTLSDGRPFIVMEFADRGSLEDRMRFAKQTSSAFSASEVAAIGIELAACLSSVHAAHIVHRDVKPSNVLFRTVPAETREALRRTGRPAPNERMLLGDFGIARRSELSGLTVVVGSPQYMAPEQADPSTAHRVDERADVYSAGVVLYELLAGTAPIAGGGRDTPDVRDVRDDVPATMAHAIRRSIAADPGARYATAWELRADLVRSLGEPVRRSRPPVETEAASPAPNNSYVIAGAANHRATDVIDPPVGTRRLDGAAAAARVAAVRPDPPMSPAAAPAGPAARSPRPPIGLLDACSFASLAGIVLVISSMCPWRTVDGMATGVTIRAGTIVFAAGGAVVIAAVIRWATRAKVGLWAVRVLSDLAALTALGAAGYHAWTIRSSLGWTIGRGAYTTPGLGAYLTLAGAALAFVAAGRAKRQLRALWLGRLQARANVRPAQPAAGPPSSSLSLFDS
jgi:serine/threonine protein kinase